MTQPDTQDQIVAIRIDQADQADLDSGDMTRINRALIRLGLEASSARPKDTTR